MSGFKLTIESTDVPAFVFSLLTVVYALKRSPETRKIAQIIPATLIYLDRSINELELLSEAMETYMELQAEGGIQPIPDIEST